MRARELVVEAELETLQRELSGYFEHEVNPVHGSVIEKSRR
jgi:hypothetical protein